MRQLKMKSSEKFRKLQESPPSRATSKEHRSQSPGRRSSDGSRGSPKHEESSSSFSVRVGGSKASDPASTPTMETPKQMSVAMPDKQTQVDFPSAGSNGSNNKPAVAQTTIESIAIKKMTATAPVVQVQQQVDPCEEAGHHHHHHHDNVPMAIVVEPRNDESVQCDCRNCQFFSGWCCMPIALIIVLVWLIYWASKRWRHDEFWSFHEHDHDNEPKTTPMSPMPSTMRTTVPPTNAW